MKNTILLICLLFASYRSYSQSDTTPTFKVKKPAPTASDTFTYSGLPISPLALSSFIPGIEAGDTIRPWSIKLQGKPDPINIDTSDGYYGTWIQQDGYEEMIAYKIVGKTDDNKFVLDVRSNGGGTLTISYIFVVKVVRDELIKVALFDAVPAYLQPATIALKGNKILTGKFVYTIP